MVFTTMRPWFARDWATSFGESKMKEMCVKPHTRQLHIYVTYGSSTDTAPSWPDTAGQVASTNQAVGTAMSSHRTLRREYTAR